MTRDFRAEAIARKRLEQEIERSARPYDAKQRTYPFIQQPQDMTDEDWRQLCEARWVLYGLPNQEQRRRYFQKVEEQRGKQSREQIQQAVMELWKGMK